MKKEKNVRRKLFNRLVGCFFLGLFCAACGPGDNAGGVRLTEAQVARYLAPLDLNSAGVAAAISRQVANSKRYRERITDQNGRRTMLTAWVEERGQTVFCVEYTRDVDCPECKGLGTKELPNFISSKIDRVGRQCQNCDGSGKLKNKKQRNCWVILAAANTTATTAPGGGAPNATPAFSGAPAGTRAKVKELGSKDPRVRLAACLWLDRNYIRSGMNALELLPLFEMARYTGAVNDDNLARKIFGKSTGAETTRVYQFWAAKGLPAEWKRGYYRIFVNASKGTVLRKTFAPDNEARRIYEREIARRRAVGDPSLFTPAAPVKP